MPIGNIHQKAHPVLSWFVIICCIVTTGLLYVMQRSVAVANVLAEETVNTSV